MPKKIKIGYMEFDIIYDRDESDRGRLGSCFKDKQKIFIDPSLKIDVQMETLLHEILHACCHFVGMDEKPMKEEEFITKICPILFTVLKENEILQKM